MSLTAYCSLEEVRAALGVTDIELSDAVLSLPVYEIGLVRELNKVSASLLAAFSTVSAIPDNVRTPEQDSLHDAVHLFSVYACARQVGFSLGVFAPKEVGDGKATMTRFSSDPYKDTLDRVDQAAQAARRDLIQVYADYSSASVTTSVTTPVGVFRASGRSYDPITG